MTTWGVRESGARTASNQTHWGKRGRISTRKAAAECLCLNMCKSLHRQMLLCAGDRLSTNVCMLRKTGQRAATPNIRYLEKQSLIHLLFHALVSYSLSKYTCLFSASQLPPSVYFLPRTDSAFTPFMSQKLNPCKPSLYDLAYLTDVSQIAMQTPYKQLH